MEKILLIDLDEKDNLFERYNKNKVSKDLIQYMIDVMPVLKKDDSLKVVINNRIKGDIHCSELIKKALDEACINNDFRFRLSNMRQMSFFIVGIFALIIASMIDLEILKEIIIIGAWVLLWDAVEMEIEDDINNRKRNKKLKKILNSEFIENKY